jgi:ubiquinone/menaquinone biosynthesis C-methylase UbiE
MNSQEPPKGVLNQRYIADRESKKQLGFRFKVRGELVAWAVRKFLAQQEGVVLLDMGAAEGKTIKYIDSLLGLKRGRGIEYSAELIAMARDMPSHLTLEQGDVTHLEGVEDSSVDVVSALAVLEHLPNPLLAVKEAARVLKPGGVLNAITSYNLPDL